VCGCVGLIAGCFRDGYVFLLYFAYIFNVNKLYILYRKIRVVFGRAAMLACFHFTLKPEVGPQCHHDNLETRNSATADSETVHDADIGVHSLSL